MIFGGLVGGIAGIVASKFEERSDTSIETTDEDDGINASGEDSDVVEIEAETGSFTKYMDKYGIKTVNIADMAISLLLMLIFASNIVTAKSSGKIFMPADVPMLFSAPIKPQSVLMFRLLSTLGTSFVFSLFMLYQIPNLVINAGFTIWGALSIVIIYILSLMFTTLLQVALYSVISRFNNVTAIVNRIVIGFFALVGIGFIAYITVTKQELVPALFGYFANPATHWVPFWGWLRGIAYNAITGSYMWSVLYLGLFILASVLVIVFIWNMKADFYEDAMFAAERKAEQLENAKRSTNGAAVIREKERKGSIDRTGFHYGQGASVFFYKAVFNRFRFARLKIFSTTMIVYMITAGIIAFIADRYVSGNDVFFIPAAVLGAMAFYRTLGDPIREDTSREFFLLIPDRNYSKIIYSLLGCLAVTAIDLLIPMIIAAVILQSNPLTVIVWFLFILSISFFANNVGTFISLSIPGESAKTIKTIIQMMFMYFGLGPSAVAIIFGIMFDQMIIALVIGMVFNFTIGFLVSLLLPVFLGRK